MSQSNNPTPIIVTYQHAMPDGRPCPDLLTAQEAGQYLRLDTVKIIEIKRTLAHYRQQAKLRGVRIGRQVLYRLEELQRFAKEKERETTEGPPSVTFRPSKRRRQ